MFIQHLYRHSERAYTRARQCEALSGAGTPDHINLLAFSWRYSSATCVLERAAAAVMESRTTGPQIPHWSQPRLQRDSERWQPPPEEKEVNIKLSDCLRLPAVRAWLWLTASERPWITFLSASFFQNQPPLRAIQLNPIQFNLVFVTASYLQP